MGFINASTMEGLGLTPMKRLDRVFDGMMDERQQWIDHWRELSKYVLPRVGRWLAADRNQGGKLNSAINNNSPTIAHRTLKDNIFGGSSSPSRRWFRLVPPVASLRDDGEVLRWLFTVENILYEIFERSNFYTAVSTVYAEETLFGTAGMIIEPNFETVIRCKVFTAGQYALSIDSDGQPIRIAREFEMTVEQLVDTFGWTGPERVSDGVMRAFKRGNYDDVRVIRHIVEKVDNNFRLRNQQPGHSWRSAYWDPSDNDQGERFLRTSGYHTRPLVAPRWDVTAEDTYGRSPVMDALPDIKGLQQLEEDIAMQVEMVGIPPSIAHPSMKNEPISLLPGTVTFGSHLAPGMPALQPVHQVDPRINEMEARAFRIEERIRKTLYADMFLLMSQALGPIPPTATQTNAVETERIQTLSQVLERQRDELLDVCIVAAYEYGFAARIFPPAPPQLERFNLKIEHISSLAQAQRAIQTQAIDRVIQIAGALAQVTQDPTAALKIDPSQTIDEAADMMGVPPKMVRPDAEVEKLINNMRQRQAQRERMEAASAGAQTAKAASETHLRDGRSALDAVVDGLR